MIVYIYFFAIFKIGIIQKVIILFFVINNILLLFIHLEFEIKNKICYL